MHLPFELRSRLQATAQWLAISLQPPQECIRVSLVTAGHEFDVTDNNVVAALDPLTIAIGLQGQMNSALNSESELHLIDRDLRRVIGVLRVHRVGQWDTSGALLGLFEVRRGTHRCTSAARRAWDRWMYQRAEQRNTPPGRVALKAHVVESMMIFYICPRPVFLISVEDGRHRNMFPMDLVGPVAPDRFTLALRNSSSSVQAIKSARKLAVASVAAADYTLAKEFGAHHRKPLTDWEQLPFRITRSREFSLPTPAAALRVRDVTVLDFRSMGSHTLFVGSIVADEKRGDGPQLFHTCGFYQHLRARQQRAFRPASTKAQG
jgi:flavin reductase (DIM6/NTAB) family NADH-FMN oxidoreductase RutF